MIRKRKSLVVNEVPIEIIPNILLTQQNHVAMQTVVKTLKDLVFFEVFRISSLQDKAESTEMKSF